MEAFFYKIINIIFNRTYLKYKLKKCGSNFKYGYHSELINPQYFSIGNDFFSGPYGYFTTNEYILVIIGDDVMFGPYCKIFGGNHDIKYAKNHIRYAPEVKVKDKYIILEDGVWIGANTTILTNAYISEGVVVSSGAIVNHFIPPYCVAYGVPAKRYKRRFTDEELKTVLKNVNSKYTLAKILNLYKEYEVV